MPEPEPGPRRRRRSPAQAGCARRQRGRCGGGAAVARRQSVGGGGGGYAGVSVLPTLSEGIGLISHLAAEVPMGAGGDAAEDVGPPGSGPDLARPRQGGRPDVGQPGGGGGRACTSAATSR